MQAPDPDRLNVFLGRMVGDLGSVASGALVVLGDRLGLYKAMGDGAKLTPDELAQRTGTNARNVREWLAAQAAAGYVDVDAGGEKFFLNPEQATAFADEDSPAFMAGAFEVLSSLWIDEPKVSESFRTGRGMAWHDHSQCLFRGTERFFRPGYNANLVDAWLPALDGVVEKLRNGACVADVGCGHGASTVIMARAFPRSHFTGFDYHPASIARAQAAAASAGVGANTSFTVASAKNFSGTFDLIAFFDCLHDMADPVGVMQHTRAALKTDGIAMLVEPFANDRVQDNLNPVGRMMYGASSQICVPVSLARNGPALGAQAGEARLRDVVVDKGGFTRFRRATETPFNLVFEARP